MQVEKLETCLRAAIRVGHEVFIGRRHDEIILWMSAKLLTKYTWEEYMKLKKEQGFITTNMRFVDRVEGLQLQLNAEIASVAPGGYRGNKLYSEDLY